jgi:long-subunit fatty acid transport protein
MRRILVALTLSTLAFTTRDLAWAQTNDHVFRSWRWEEEVVAARPGGLAGAFVAVANDSSTAALNPAGLLSLPRRGREVAASALRRGSGTAGSDSLLSRTDLAYGAAVMPLGSSWAVGVHYQEPRALRLEVAPFVLPSGVRDHGFVEAELHDFGVSAAYLVSPRFRVGAGLTASRLELESNYGVSRNAVMREIVNQGSEDTRLRPSAGLTYDAGSSVRLGLAARPGASWEVDRASFDPETSIVIDPGSTNRVRAPDVYSGGAAWRVRPRLLVTGQLDFVRYSQIRDDLEIWRNGVPSDDYVLDDAFEVRAGAEYTIPLDPFDLALRGGLYSQAPGSLAYVGPNEDEAAAFRGDDRRLLGALGATIMLRQGFGLDAATVWGGDRRHVLVGARYRF